MLISSAGIVVHQGGSLKSEITIHHHGHRLAGWLLVRESNQTKLLIFAVLPTINYRHNELDEVNRRGQFVRLVQY